MRRLIIILAALLLLVGCSAETAQRSAFLMDTIVTVTVCGKDGGRAADGAIALLSELSGRWSVTDEGSELYRLNSSGTAQLSEDTAELISFAMQMNSITGGALDITLYPVLREWGFTTGEYTVPDEQRIRQLLQLTGADKLTLSGNTASLSNGAMADLGAVAKGYAGDLLCEYLRENGCGSALLDLGGNIHAIGEKPGGGAWRIGVRDPNGGENLAVLRLTDMAAVTSGGYERYFIAEDGTRYCHIIDPETGRPAESGLASVTVVGKEGRLCDALSTAVYVMGAERAARLHAAVGGFELLLVTDDGDMLITDGMAEIMEISESFGGSVQRLY